MKIAKLEVADSSFSCSDMNSVGGKAQRQPSNSKYNNLCFTTIQNQQVVKDKNVGGKERN